MRNETNCNKSFRLTRKHSLNSRFFSRCSKWKSDKKLSAYKLNVTYQSNRVPLPFSSTGFHLFHLKTPHLCSIRASYISRVQPLKPSLVPRSASPLTSALYAFPLAERPFVLHVVSELVNFPKITFKQLSKRSVLR